MRPTNAHHKRDATIMTVLWPYCLRCNPSRHSAPSTSTRLASHLMRIAFTVCGYANIRCSCGVNPCTLRCQIRRANDRKSKWTHHRLWANAHSLTHSLTRTPNESPSLPNKTTVMCFINVDFFFFLSPIQYNYHIRAIDTDFFSNIPAKPDATACVNW